MDSSLVSSHVALLVAMGAVGFIGLVHLGFWRRSDPAHLWVALWCLFTLVFQAARHVQIHTDAPLEAVRASRLEAAMTPMLIWSLVCFARSLRPRARDARFALGFLALNGGLAALILCTPWFVSGATRTRTDWFGDSHISTPAAPAMLLLVPYIAGALVWVARVLWASAQLGSRERRVLVASLVGYAAIGVLSVLSAINWIPIPISAEFGPLLVVLGLNYLLVHRHRRLQTRLEDMVAERTAEIAAAYERLTESEMRYRGLVENAPVGVFACNREGELTAVNPRLLELLGSPSERHTRRFNVFRFPPLVEAGVASTMRRCMEREATVEGEHTYTSAWGKTSEVRLTAAAIRDASGEVSGALGIVEDLAERRSLERRLRQSQKMESVGQLAAGIAHEINNPMAYVRTNLSVLRSEWDGLRSILEKAKLPDEVVERLEGWEELIDESLEGVERTVAIVRDMKEFSHAGGNARVRADLNRLIESSVRVATTHRKGSARIEEIYGDVPSLVCAPGPLRQVFLNLVVNALQAVGTLGRVRISTRVEGGEAVVRIEDDGPGIPAEIQERLFDPFFTTKPAGEGTGLGLYVSYEIVRLHSGEIRVDSRPEGGSRFEVRLPIGNPDRPS